MSSARAENVPVSKLAPRPRSADGRPYPVHFRKVEKLDAEVLPVVAQVRRGTFDDIAVQIKDPVVRSQLVRWLASAEWRDLITCSKATRPQTYQLGPEAQQYL